MYPQQQFVPQLDTKQIILHCLLTLDMEEEKTVCLKQMQQHSPDKLQKYLNSTRNLKHIDIGVLDANAAQLESSSHLILNFLLQFSLVVFVKLNKLTTIS